MPRQKSSTTDTGAETQTTGKSAGRKAQATDAVALLKADHRNVEALFEKFEQADGSEEKEKIARKICQELITHTLLEEEIFYPECREQGVESKSLDEAQVEHDGAKVMINELLEASADDEFFDAKVTVLKEYIKHHVGEEEKPRGGIFAQAKKAGLDMDALGQRLQARKEQISGKAEGRQSSQSLSPPQYRALHVQQPQGSESRTMARQQDGGRYGSQGYGSRDNYGSQNYSAQNRNQSRFNRDDSDRYGSQQYQQGNITGNRWNYHDEDQQYGNQFARSTGNRQQSQEGNWRNRDQGYGSSSSYGRDDDDRYSGRQTTGTQYGGGSQYGESQYGNQSGYGRGSRGQSGQRDWEESGSSYRSRDAEDLNRSSRRSGANYGTSYDEDADEREASRGSRSRGWSEDEDTDNPRRSTRSWEDR